MSKTIIVDGKKIATDIRERLAKEIIEAKEKGINPKLAVVLVGNDQPSHVYVGKKQKAAEKIGIDFTLYTYPEEITAEELKKEVVEIQKKDPALTGLIVQLPLPKHISIKETKEILNLIDPKIDVDCLTYTNLGKLVTGKNTIEPPTPGAIMEVLRYHNVDLKGKNVALVGRGELIGKPLVNMLFREPVTVSVCSSATRDLSEFTKNADIVISGVGKYNLILGKILKEGVAVVDAGVCFHEGKIYGDIDFESVSQKASLVTPTPGGVGPITVAKLLENTVKCAFAKF